MLNPHIKFTYDDYKSLPESETARYELLEGELIMVPSPSEPHQSVSLNLTLAVGGHTKQKGLGHMYVAPFDVVLGEGRERDVVQPDLLFVANDRLHIVTTQEVAGAPDLIVEILSPSTAERDKTYKRLLYALHGVKEYWLVDPEKKTIEVLQLGVGGFHQHGFFFERDTLTSPLLTDLRLALADVFPND